MIRRLRPAFWVALVTAFVLLCCAGGAVAFFVNVKNQTGSADIGGGCGKPAASYSPNAAQLSGVGGLGSEQTRNANIIIQVGEQMNVPARGWVIAIATALQESGLRNLGNLGSRNDHDSVGLFQQRPSQGWGTVAQIMDPQYASRQFYTHLLRVPNWQHLSLTEAAQAVQRSAFPDAYAKHEPQAAAVVNALTDGAARAAGTDTTVDLNCANAGVVSAAGWVVPVKGRIASGFRTPERPTHNGVDLAVPKNTPIHAASDGQVIRVRCQAIAPGGGDWGCDRDGGLNVGGCGWYLDIQHANGYITRYCHQIRHPRVNVGDLVTAGEVIGWSGDSGHSSGPHVHFEVHVDSNEEYDGAIDPVPFMQQMGAPLGLGG